MYLWTPSVFLVTGFKLGCLPYFSTFTDEQALAEAGVDDFSDYAVDPSMPLQSDFYI